MTGCLPTCLAVVGAGQAVVILEPGLTAAILAILAAASFVFICWRHPIWLLRGFLWLICHTVYRLRVNGRDNVPAQGPALLVCNHVTYMDWLLILAAQPRFIRFVIFAGWTRRWGLRHLLRWARVIPIDGSAGPRRIVESLRAASDALAAEDLVCIFAEGRFTRTGFLLPFHRGFEQIVKRFPAPVVPVCLDQLWGSIFSFRGGKIIWKWPQRLPKPVTVAFGAPLPPTATAAEVRLAVQKLSADCAIGRSGLRRPVHSQLIRKAASHPLRPCLLDAEAKGQGLRYAGVVTRAALLARELRPLLGNNAMVGLWLPPSVPAALANIALAFLGKPTVNLNTSWPPETLQAVIRQAGIRHILTRNTFAAQLKLQAPPEVTVIDLEMIKLSRWRMAAGFLAVLLLPGKLLEVCLLGASRPNLDPLVTVIFTSRGDGEMRGAMLSHRNVAANCEAMVDAIDVRPVDRALGILPFCTGWGYTANLWVPLQVGASVVFHAGPRQAEEIGAICRVHQCTVLLAPPAFLRSCLEPCAAGDFASLRILMCGSESLPPGLAREFQAKFGILLLEGYGCPELTAAATANVPDKEIEKFRQVGNMPGTVGQPLPGITARIVHPETFEPLPTGQPGLLLVQGANVMIGYLGCKEWTSQVVRDGWYVTGEIATINEEGFVTLTNRLSR